MVNYYCKKLVTRSSPSTRQIAYIVSLSDFRENTNIFLAEIPSWSEQDIQICSQTGCSSYEEIWLCYSKMDSWPSWYFEVGFTDVSVIFSWNQCCVVTCTRLKTHQNLLALMAMRKPITPMFGFGGAPENDLKSPSGAPQLNKLL